ncbi:zinc-dependent alcohol dehydrogenase [Microbacterium sp. JB110]|uniref:zinc-dependent alcohol dehydrogenase n=1 Tax=unclassified Microbacterium TaxID=2609290 RepID=UPI00097EC3A7|nr:zinc-binding alcohol dehydrogenase [Microbacterium sp. JB110]SJM62435.1 Threonine dehydrogenase and related Zn-dependent dehydrogenases [Frigoribacterium sp. JB110]
MQEAAAFWIERPHVGAMRTQPLPSVGEDDVLVRTQFSGISAGTETLVFRGEVPAAESERMRAPFQEGDFPGPVKYGYQSVGVVIDGRPDLVGRTVFALHPHQSAFVLPADAVFPLPEGVPPRRAVLAGAVETALNVAWDAAPRIGDRIVVIGAGTIGCCIARLLRGIPETDVTLVDIDPMRQSTAAQLGVRFAEAAAAPGDRDIAIHASGSGSGLQLALESVAEEGTVIEASWYGDRPVTVSLGSDFHSRRLSIRSSQVGAVSSSRRGSRTRRDRLALALRLLRDSGFDALLGAESSWRELPEVMASLADGTSERGGTGPCLTIDWKDAP